MKKRRKTVSKKFSSSDRFFIVFCLIVGILCIFESIQYCIMLNTWDSGGVIDYTGIYEVQKIRILRRNTVYVFKLSNGDAVVYQDVDNINEMTDVELVFQYSSHKGVVRYTGAHIGVAIKSLDGSIAFAEEKEAKSELVGLTIIFSLIGIVFILFAMTPFFLDLWMKRLFKKSGKKKEKMRKPKPI